jgi:single-strand DNA-binding protein
MQHITVTGNAGGDGDYRFSPQGKPVLRFSVADNFKRSDGTDGPTTWFDVQAWGPLAELYADKIKRGAYVTVAGRVDLNEWEKDGVKHAKLRITAQAIGVAEPRASAQCRGTVPQDANAQHRPATAAQAAPAQVAPEEEDPFGDQ